MDGFRNKVINYSVSSYCFKPPDICSSFLNTIVSLHNTK